MKKKAMYILKTTVSFVLVVAMIIGMCPYVSAAETEYTILEVQSETKLKKDCYAKSETIEVISEKTLLYAVGSTVNKHNNVWFQVLYAGDEGAVSQAFVYGGDVCAHECEFSTQGDDRVTVRYCRCGQLQVIDEQDSEHQLAYTDTLNPTGISPEVTDAILGAVAAARGFIKAGGQYAGQVIKALANPIFLVPVVVSAGVIWIALACNGITVSIDHVKENYSPFDDCDMEEGKFYCALVITGSNGGVFFLDLPEAEMNVEEAAAFMTLVAGFRDAYTIRKSRKTSELFGNVYTRSFTDAEELRDLLEKTGVFRCVNDEGVAGKIAINKFKVPGVEYYRHYHMQFTGNLLAVVGSMMTHPLPNVKVEDSHIFFGNPVIKPVA